MIAPVRDGEMGWIGACSRVVKVVSRARHREQNDHEMFGTLEVKPLSLPGGNVDVVMMAINGAKVGLLSYDQSAAKAHRAVVWPELSQALIREKVGVACDFMVFSPGESASGLYRTILEGTHKAIKPSLRQALANQVLGKCEGWLKLFESPVQLAEPSPQDLAGHLAMDWKNKIFNDHAFLSAADVAAKMGSTATNRSAQASRMECQGLIFSVKHQQKLHYLACQIRHEQPLPIFKDLIALFKEHLGDSFDGWDLAAFLLQPNSYLSGVKPIKLILNEAKSRDRVIEIAKAHLQSPDVY